MKEITLRELMSMADQEAHDGIGNLWNDKTIHHLVIFTSADEDFEIIGVGPSLPYTTLEDAAQHVVPGKTAEFFLKCPAANPNRLQPKLAPSLKPATPRPALASPVPAPTSTPPPAPEAKVEPAIAQLAESMLGSAHGNSTSVAPVPAALASTSGSASSPQSPSLKARTSAPFLRPAIKLEPKLVKAAVGSGSVKTDTETVKTETPKVAAVESPRSALPVAAADSALAERERAIAQREKELAALADALKIHEASLREREAAIVAIEDCLLNPARKSDR